MKAYDQQERRQLGANIFEKRQQLSFTKKVIQLNDHVRLMITIVIQNKVVTYLSIVSIQPKNFSAIDYLILTKMSNVISVLLMMTLIKVNSSEADEDEFTKNLLLRKLTDPDEILSLSRYFRIDIKELYTVVILRGKTNMSNIQKEMKQFVRRQLQKYRFLISTQNRDFVIILRI